MSNKNLKFPTKFLPSENVIAHVAPLIHRYCLKFNPEENQRYTLPAEAVPRDFLQWFTTTFNNIGVDSLEIIYTPAGKISTVETKDNFVKINHVYSNSGVNVSLVPAKEHNIDHNYAYLKYPVELAVDNKDSDLASSYIAKQKQLRGIV